VRAFYASPNQAAENISDYLMSPPQLSHLRESVVHRVLPIIAVKEEGPLFYVCQYDVDGALALEQSRR